MLGSYKHIISDNSIEVVSKVVSTCNVYSGLFLGQIVSVQQSQQYMSLAYINIPFAPNPQPYTPRST